MPLYHFSFKVYLTQDLNWRTCSNPLTVFIDDDYGDFSRKVITNTNYKEEEDDNNDDNNNNNDDDNNDNEN